MIYDLFLIGFVVGGAIGIWLAVRIFDHPYWDRNHGYIVEDTGPDPIHEVSSLSGANEQVFGMRRPL